MSLLHLTANIKWIPVRPFDVEYPFALFELCSKFLETKMQDTATGWACLRSICGSCTLPSYWLWQDEAFSKLQIPSTSPLQFLNPPLHHLIFFFFFFFQFFPGPFEIPPPFFPHRHICLDLSSCQNIEILSLCTWKRLGLNQQNEIWKQMFSAQRLVHKSSAFCSCLNLFPLLRFCFCYSHNVSILASAAHPGPSG